MLSVRMNVEYIKRLGGSLNSPGVDETLELFGLKGYEKEYPTTLSAGLNQRLALAMTWVKGTPIVALDEPFDFLDEEAKQSLSQLLLESKKTVIVATNMEPPFASRFRVIRMKELKKEMGLAL
jgi:NitT/TauT family transport system ATP-binding protein